MISTRSGLIIAALAFGASVTTTGSVAQDFPTFKGDNVRTGKGSLPNTSGPSTALLTWFRPNSTDNVGRIITVDNLYSPDPTALPSPPPTFITQVGTWTGPAVIEEAANPYLPNFNDEPAGVDFPGGAANFAYVFSETIASAVGSDPRIPLNGGDPLNTFTWSLHNPTAPFYEAQNYAVYVSLPTGPTVVGGVLRFPQRFYVYEVTYSGGTWLEILDTDRVGGGWIRLGNGGLPTDKLFPSDGLTPLQVKLYNTVPRDPSTGILTTNPATGSNDLDLSKPRPLVYADAVLAVPLVGSYAATPIVGSFDPGTGLQIRTVGALNRVSIGSAGGEVITSTKGEVTSYDYNTGFRRWIFSPLDEGSLTFNQDNTSVGVTTTGGAWAADTTAANFRGADYLSAVTVNVPASASTVEYSPVLPDMTTALQQGTYDIYVWIPGESNGETFAKFATYEINEGATVTTVTVDQSVTSGWLRLGNRRFAHEPSIGDPLKVVVTNYSADPGDVGREAFTDAIRFVGANNLTVTSTPVQVTARVRMTRFAAPVDKPVVIVPAENGTIYCVDANGRGDGTTDILWTYPSTEDESAPPGTWQDPNLNPPDAVNTDWEEIDGTANSRSSEMPIGFGLTSAVVQRINGEDYLFIGSSNGRVYCLELAGRGDMNLATRRPGTTRRMWTYPDDFPAPVPLPSSLGPITGSVAFANIADGPDADPDPDPTVFVPTMQGRMIALDAVGTPATRTTTTRWVYPPLTSPTLGPIASTPAIEFGKVFFGTRNKDDFTLGEFLALNMDTGALMWTLAGTAAPLDDFNGGPVTAPSALLSLLMPDTVYASNDNRYVYAMDASTGGILWETNELEASCRTPMTYTVMNVLDNGGLPVDRQVIVVPRTDGVISTLSAITGDVTLTGRRRARGDFFTESNSLTASAAVGWNFLYYADNAGYLYARSVTLGGHTPGTEPGAEGVGENDPGYDNFDQARIRLVRRSAYDLLRRNQMYYNDAVDPVNEVVRNPMAFEWGETIYLLIYNFPYKRTGSAIPPVVNITFSVGGQTVRNVFAEGRRFPGISVGVDFPGGDTDPQSGYAIYSFTVQNAGAYALPPGEGEISIAFNTTDATGAQVNFPAAQRMPFFVANPLALVIPSPIGSNQTIGYTNVTSDPQSIANGSALVPNLLASVGSVSHGQSGNIQIGVVDRSLMTLVKGPGRGLSNVRVLRADLAWNAGLVPGPGVGMPLKPIDALLFPGFEDLPFNYPNTSLDYPDIKRERIRITKGLLENAENPVSYPVDLLPPTAPDGSALTEVDAAARLLLVTPFDFDVDVPLFQPTNEVVATDSAGAVNVSNGYTGNYFVYVDSSSNGQLDRGLGAADDGQEPLASREAYRSFAFGSSVARDQRLSVLTPVVDLQALASGTGYTPIAPGPANATFDPWTGTYMPLFKPFEVANDGNVNLLNLRLAKATTDDAGATFFAWQILSPANENLAYIDGEFDLWSDMDPAYAPSRALTPDAPVILQKSRVGDRFARRLSVNPVSRINPYLGVTQEAARMPEATYPIGPARVAVTVPFGFPQGTYTELLRVIEDTVPGSNPASMALDLDPTNDNALELYSDPTLRVIFKVRESRLTNTFVPRTSPFVDDILTTGAESFRYSNMQPTGFRHPENGSLVMAWVSSRPDWAGAVPAGPITNPAWRIYVGSVDGLDPTSSPGTSPLRDLNAFQPDVPNGRWFKQSPLTSTGFPSIAPDNLFATNVPAGQSILPQTVKFGSPSMPVAGMVNSFRVLPNGTPAPNHADVVMAFVGEAQVQTPSGRQAVSKIFVAPVTVDADGDVGMGDVWAMTSDPLASKGRPSVVQTFGSDFILFYSATVGGKSSIYFTNPSDDAAANDYDGSRFRESAVLSVGSGFESVWSPSVTGRLYQGVNSPLPTGVQLLEMTFAGKLRGRPVNEIFYGRVELEAEPDNDMIPVGFYQLPEITRERMTAGNEPGTYVAQGINWDTGSTIRVDILRGGVYTDIEVPGTRAIDRATRLVTFNTRLGGKAYVDPTTGIIRLTGGSPGPSASLHATYSPLHLRVTEGTGAGYASPSLSFDDRLIPDNAFWFRTDESAVDDTDQVRVGRYLFGYVRAAAGGGQAARPFMKTMRLGVELPLPVFTDANGTIPLGNLTIAAENSYFQVDPAKKKIYFTQEDEDNTVTITYVAADEATGRALPGTQTVVAKVGMIVERSEAAVPLDFVQNESNLYMFVDPFDLPTLRRPGLVWMFWTSTRAGAPDLFFQTIAPKFTPVVVGEGE